MRWPKTDSYEVIQFSMHAKDPRSAVNPAVPSELREQRGGEVTSKEPQFVLPARSRVFLAFCSVFKLRVLTPFHFEGEQSILARKSRRTQA